MTTQLTEPTAVVTAFLDGMAAGDLDSVTLMIGENIVYTNVGLPTVRGRRKVVGIFDAMDAMPFGINGGFDYAMINVASEGRVVLTERIDELTIGRVVLRFWVCGRFEVDEDGTIAVWRDYFDFYDMTKSLGRALLGVVAPSLNRKLPR